MLTKRSFSDTSRITKLAGVLASSLILFACGGTGGGTSSSPTSSSKSSTASSTSSVSSGNVAAGKTQFEARCVVCHTHQGSGNFSIPGKDPFNINAAQTKHSGLNGLVKYVADAMPPNNPALCAGSCAADTTAYMLSVAGTATAACNTNAQAYGMRTARLLTARELRNSLLDLGIGQENELTEDLFSSDATLTKSKYPIHTHVNTAVDDSRNDAMQFAADKLAPVAATRLVQQWGCSSNASNCATQFLTLAERIFRRPVTAEERTVYTALFTKYGATTGTEVAIAAAITSPQFLYRSEVGTKVSEARNNAANFGTPINLANVDQSAYILDNYEFATALAYMYTGSTPDATLLQAAKGNQLATEAQVNTQIDRLLASNRGIQHMMEFGANWMRTDDVLNARRPSNPEFTDAIKTDMAREVRELFKYVFNTSNVSFEQFYAGDASVINKRLATYYGINNFSGTDSDWRSTTIPNRGGILGTGAFSVGNSQPDRAGPIKKAVDIRELMLCHHIGAPPTDFATTSKREELVKAVANRETNVGDLTTREFFELVTHDPACDQCHQTMINPLFGIDDVDHLGKFRTEMRGLGPNGQSGLRINNSGQLIGLSSVDDLGNTLSFNGSKDLGKKMAVLPSVRECLITNSFRYATGLPIEKKAYSTQEGGQDNEPAHLTRDQEETFACAKQTLEQAYTSSNGSAKNVYRRLGTLDLIRLRKPITSSQVKQ